MIELRFKLTNDGSEPRVIVVRIQEPTTTPSGNKWPWGVEVDVDGRPSTTYGMDPLDAIENGAQHAARLLRGIYGDALDPHIEPRS